MIENSQNQIFRRKYFSPKSQVSFKQQSLEYCLNYWLHHVYYLIILIEVIETYHDLINVVNTTISIVLSFTWYHRKCWENQIAFTLIFKKNECNSSFDSSQDNQWISV